MIYFGDVFLKVKESILPSITFSFMLASSLGYIPEVKPSSPLNFGNEYIFGSTVSEEKGYLDYSGGSFPSYALKLELKPMEVKNTSPKCLESCLDKDGKKPDRVSLYSDFHPFP